MKNKDAIKKMKKKKEEIASKSKFSKAIRIKDGETVRMRALPTGPDSEFAIEAISFYLGTDGAEGKKYPMSFISPSTINKPCAFSDFHDEMVKKEGKQSEVVKSLRQKVKFLMPVVVREASSGPDSKKIKTEDGVQRAELSSAQFRTLVDWMLDEEEAGDFSDPSSGFDIKMSREGSGQLDTRYTFLPCKANKLSYVKSEYLEYSKIVNLEEWISHDVPSYEDTKKWLDNYLNQGDEEESETTSSTKSRIKGKKKKKKIQVKKSRIS